MVPTPTDLVESCSSKLRVACWRPWSRCTAMRRPRLQRSSHCARRDTWRRLPPLHGLDRFRTTQQPVRLDVSGAGGRRVHRRDPPSAPTSSSAARDARSGRYLVPSGLFPCRDGLVRIRRDRRPPVAGHGPLPGRAPWTKGLETRRPASRACRATITERVEAWTRPQDKAACADRPPAPACPRRRSTAPSSSSSHPSSPSRLLPATPRPPVSRCASPVPRGERRRGGADGRSPVAREPVSRVLELTHVLAGPIVGSLLGAMGAHVVRLEDEPPRHLPPYRAVRRRRARPGAAEA